MWFFLPSYVVPGDSEMVAKQHRLSCSEIAGALTLTVNCSVVTGVCVSYNSFQPITIKVLSPPFYKKRFCGSRHQFKAKQRERERDWGLEVSWLQWNNTNVCHLVGVLIQRHLTVLWVNAFPSMPGFWGDMVICSIIPSRMNTLFANRIPHWNRMMSNQQLPRFQSGIWLCLPSEDSGQRTTNAANA